MEVAADAISWRDAVRVIEDYKPLDVQSATMGLALLREVRRRYPDWRYLIDGDGGDENLKDYPIEDNPELTDPQRARAIECSTRKAGASMPSSIRSSTAAARVAVTSAPPRRQRRLASADSAPYAVPDVIEAAEAIPFVELTDWDHEKLYDLKGKVVAAGVRQITGVEMPVFPKQRFQRGAADAETFARLFPQSEREYRQVFTRLFQG